MGKQQRNPYRVAVSTPPGRASNSRRAMRNQVRWRARHPAREVLDDRDFMAGVRRAMIEMETVETW